MNTSRIPVATPAGPVATSSTDPLVPAGPAWSGPVRALTRAEVGRAGEDIAARHLSERGWHILDRNFRVARGEIDIIALDGRTLVLVEVKTRRSVMAGIPQEAVDPGKIARIRRLLGYYLMENSPPHIDVRIDVVAVLLLDDGPIIEHIAGVGA